MNLQGMVYIFITCGPKSYFTLFCNLIGYASGPYEPVRTARDLNRRGNVFIFQNLKTTLFKATF